MVSSLKELSRRGVQRRSPRGRKVKVGVAKILRCRSGMCPYRVSLIVFTKRRGALSAGRQILRLMESRSDTAERGTCLALPSDLSNEGVT